MADGAPLGQLGVLGADQGRDLGLEELAHDHKTSGHAKGEQAILDRLRHFAHRDADLARQLRDTSRGQRFWGSADGYSLSHGGSPFCRVSCFDNPRTLPHGKAFSWRTTASLQQSP